MGLFAGKEIITAPDVAKELGLSERMARNPSHELGERWMAGGNGSVPPRQSL
jgi:hypothetical protein